MRTLIMMLLGLAMVVAATVSPGVYATEPSQVIADHLAMAKSYEEKAAALDKVIAEHEQMKKDYKTQYFINEKVTPVAGLKKMNEHCNAIINDAEKLKAQYLDFAKWHRMRAAELQGK
jgi:hypothetical protein